MTPVIQLQAHISRECDSGWLPDITAELLPLAREDRRGRRWLCEQLWLHFPVFRHVDDAALNTLIEQDLMINKLVNISVQWWRAEALVLGAMLQAAAICKVISGSQVRAVRAVLGESLYHSIMPLGLDRTAPVMVPRADIGSAEWRLELQQCGAAMLYAWAQSRHPFIADRITAVFPPQWSIHRYLQSTSWPQQWVADRLTQRFGLSASAEGMAA